MTKKTDKNTPVSISFIAKILGVAELRLQELLLHKTGVEEFLIWEEIPFEYMGAVTELVLENFDTRASKESKETVINVQKKRDEPFEIVIDLSKIRAERNVIVKFI